MQVPQIPADEASRLGALRSLGVLDTPPEERFDRLTRLARRVFDVPIALVSLVDETRQWFKSCQGLDVDQTDREVSFCGHAILRDRLFEICDATADERFADNPLVTGPPHIRYYAGRPLRAPDGSRVGTLCIIDRRARRMSAEDVQVFEDLAALAEAELAAVQVQTTDSLTGLTNRAGFELLSGLAFKSAARARLPGDLLSISVRDFDRVREWMGQGTADQALRMMARQLKCAFRGSDVLGRTSVDSFHVLSIDTDEGVINGCLEHFTQLIERSSYYELRGEPMDFDITRLSFAVSDALDPREMLDRARSPAPADERSIDEPALG